MSEYRVTVDGESRFKVQVAYGTFGENVIVTRGSIPIVDRDGTYIEARSA